MTSVRHFTSFKLLCIMSLVQFTGSVSAQDNASAMGKYIRGASEHHLVVEVKNAEPVQGSLEISLFKNDEFFMKQAFLQNSGAVREDGTFNALFNKLEPGEYAVVVVHDANDNQKFDSGLLGWGGENYAYSTNYRPWFGRPDFEDIKIEVEGSTVITIDMQ